jgi:hypothetical protein
MFDGFYFEFPKLAFLLFAYLGCEALCPLRSNPLFFPQIRFFGEVGVRSPLWIWIAKWGMIILLIIALMSPVIEREETARYSGYSTLLAVDPSSLDEGMKQRIGRFIEQRPHDQIALYIPSNPSVKIPMSADHQALHSIVAQCDQTAVGTKIDHSIRRFLPVQKRQWIVIFSNDPRKFVHSLPTLVEVSVAPDKDWDEWLKRQKHEHPAIPIVSMQRKKEYYYFYPLFLAFISMLVYLYGRNQKGLG